MRPSSLHRRPLKPKQGKCVDRDVGGSSSRVATELENHTQAGAEKTGETRPQPEATVRYDVESREEQCRRQQTDDRLQQGSDQRLLGQSGKDRYGSGIGDRPVPHHLLLPFLEVGKSRMAAQGPEHGRTECARDHAGENPGGQRPAGREAAEHPLRAKGQSDQCDDTDHSLLVNNGDRGDRSGRGLFMWTHVVINPLVARLLRAIVREWFVDAVNRLVDLEVVIVVFDSLGPRNRHHAIALGEADHSHTLGGASKA